MDNTLNVLLIDDDQVDRMATIRILNKRGALYNITEATTASDGLKLALKQNFDAILLDYHMPGMDGIEMLQLLRTQANKRVAVLMLSRQDDEALAEQCLDAGAQDFLLKDEIDHRRLTRALHQAQHRNMMEEALLASRNELLQLVEHDILTGLVNRRGFERALSAAASRLKRGSKSLAVLLLDLDDFKSVNDSDGHDVGDALLIEVTQRLSSAIRESDLLCRLGGDEFVLLVDQFDDNEQVLLLAERLIEVLREPYAWGDKTHIATASIGVAIYDPSMSAVTDLLRFADMAMYQAKQAGRNQSRVYSSSLGDAALNRNRIKFELQNAVANNEMRVFYQAQIRTSDGSLGGLEALVRWQHPVLGLLSPASFIAIAEEVGTIVDIGNWVLLTACEQLGQWQLKYPSAFQNVSLGVNLSVVQVSSTTLLDTVSKALERFDVNVSNLEMEITESVLIKDPEAVSTVLAQLVEQGVFLSLDDFGTGYSSLEHLKIFPISVLKVDRGFVGGVGKDKKAEQLLVAIIALAKALEMRVVAEGVETEEQAHFCRKHGCDLLQGYYFSMPITAEEFEARFLR
ncbi:putative bifunctional diguanylate cyclase/phosphodiesterase [Alishewanella sp. HL-SH05]|uniref:putative bifunctional diguanylate cyclase/phosphodiesterase n=1 Tax=Alishewanella sp. HL-SH05 TaxID=3461145 RepID=UPI004042B29D